MACLASIPTRTSLLERLRHGDDVEGWREFYRVYGPLLTRFALKRGLSESEAEEVVQETAIGVARGLSGFCYVPARCSFKTWMLNLARWRIGDALRRRRTDVSRPGAAYGAGDPEPGGRRALVPEIENIPDPHVISFGTEWDAAWDRHLTEMALDRVRRLVDPRNYQIFDLYVLKQRPAQEVARRIGVHVARVYLAKQRVAARARREFRKLSEGVDPRRG